MTTVLTLNLDGSFQEIQPLAVSLGASSADQLVRLNSYGQFDSSVIPPITVSLLSASGTPSNTTYLRGDGTWATVSGSGGATLVNPSYSKTIGDGSSTVYTIVHNLNTTNINVSVFENSGLYRQITVDNYRNTI